MTDQRAADLRSRYPNYEIISPLGRGAMGVVYLAKDKRIGRRVALKTVQLDGVTFDDPGEAREFFDRLQREAELCGMLQHPNIVTLYEAGVQANIITFLAFEYVEGETLQQIIRAKKVLPLEEALSYADDILKALKYAHSRGIIHRDIKPANILVSSDGEAKLADFGIAKPQESNLTVAGTMMGTPNYMSPEHVTGDAVSAASDLFSFGVVFYEMLTGTKPFTGPDVSGILYRVVHAQVPPPSELRPELGKSFDGFFAKILAKKVEERFASAGEALDALERLEIVQPVAPATAESTLSDAPVTHLPSTGAEVPAKRRKNVPAVAWVTVVAALLLPLAAFVYSSRREASAPIVPRHSAAELEEFRAKRQQLARAAELLESGRLEESIAAYKTYLQKYPYSIVAQAGLVEAEKRATTVEVAATRAPDTRARRGSSAEKTSAKKPKRGWSDLRRRVKKIFD